MFRNAKRVGWMLTCLAVAGCSPFEQERQPQVVPGPYSRQAAGTSNPNQLRPGMNPQQQQGGAVVPPMVTPPASPNPYGASTSNLNNPRTLTPQTQQAQSPYGGNAPFNSVPVPVTTGQAPYQAGLMPPTLNNNSGFNNNQYTTQPNQ